MNVQDFIGKVFRNRANLAETFRVHEVVMKGSRLFLVGTRSTCCTSKRSIMLWTLMEHSWELVE